MPNEFDEQPVLSYSVVHAKRSDQLRPNWFRAFVDPMVVQDEVQLL